MDFTKKGAIDTVAILLDHEIGEEEVPETVNAKYIAKLLADDWGFWYTATNNLRKVKEALPSIEGLEEGEVEDVSSKIDLLLEYIEKEPKTKKWQKRAKVGTKKRWYKEVRL